MSALLRVVRFAPFVAFAAVVIALAVTGSSPLG